MAQPAPETMLWVNVLVLAIQDARRGDSEARHWLLFNSLDFQRVCELAGACPVKTRKSVRRMLRQKRRRR